jgi:hypothetical protein
MHCQRFRLTADRLRYSHIRGDVPLANRQVLLPFLLESEERVNSIRAMPYAIRGGRLR